MLHRARGRPFRRHGEAGFARLRQTTLDRLHDRGCSTIGTAAARAIASSTARLLSLLAYAGLRPESEALALRWEDVRERVLFVPAGRKRGAGDRTVRLFPRCPTTSKPCLASPRRMTPPGLRRVERRALGWLTGAGLPRGREPRGPADRRPAARPARELRLAAPRQGSVGPRDRPPARPLAGDVPARLRRAVRRLRPCRARSILRARY